MRKQEEVCWYQIRRIGRELLDVISGEPCRNDNSCVNRGIIPVNKQPAGASSPSSFSLEQAGGIKVGLEAWRPAFSWPGGPLLELTDWTPFWSQGCVVYRLTMVASIIIDTNGFPSPNGYIDPTNHHRLPTKCPRSRPIKIFLVGPQPITLDFPQEVLGSDQSKYFLSDPNQSP